MKSLLLLFAVSSLLAFQTAQGIQAPTGLVIQAGDGSIVLHWERNPEPNVGSYRVYHSLSNSGPFSLLSATAAMAPGYCDLNVTNGQSNFYYVTAVGGTVESDPSITIAATPHPFANDDEFLDYVQQTCFDYFWYAANPTNGLVPDRSAKGSPCSIAAVGFGLTAIGIAIDHGWITRTQGVTRVLTTLNTFLNLPQGTSTFSTIGYRGWFYHFLDMNTGLRYTTFNTELSSIDTALLLGGVLYAKQYFNGTNSDETAIRSRADAIFNRVDWRWMTRGTSLVSMGWNPSTGTFLSGNWTGYNEAMIIYCLGLGAVSNSLPTTSWTNWTRGYTWTTNYGQAHVPFPSLFVHQYSHCWIDFRHIADSYMTAHNSTYFENSRRASLANLGYCTNNPQGHVAYSSLVWGLSACDGPNVTVGGVTYQAYAARGAPNGFDDGTLAPTAAGGAIAFTPEYSIPTLRYFYTNYLRNIWTAYGFRDSFNLDISWWDTDELGIDQGPIVIMIENYRTQKVWKLFMKNPEVQNGLQRAGFSSVSSIPASIQAQTDVNSCKLTWNATTARTYQVEYSPDLETWFACPAGELTATNDSGAWTDAGPPETESPPLSTKSQRFYRVIQYGPP